MLLYFECILFTHSGLLNYEQNQFFITVFLSPLFSFKNIKVSIKSKLYCPLYTNSNYVGNSVENHGTTQQLVPRILSEFLKSLEIMVMCILAYRVKRTLSTLVTMCFNCLKVKVVPLKVYESKYQLVQYKNLIALLFWYSPLGTSTSFCWESFVSPTIPLQFTFLQFGYKCFSIFL